MCTKKKCTRFNEINAQVNIIILGISIRYTLALSEVIYMADMGGGI